MILELFLATLLHPFDRMLVAQSQVEGLVCVTRDPAFDLYGVPCLW